jgi:hypothetical protein
MYEAELNIEQDPQRRLALLRDEAGTRRTAGDLAGATRALTRAREIDDQDPGLSQELAGTVLDRLQVGDPVNASERAMASELLVGLAEVYDGEHGIAYASGALDIEAGHDRALQLYAYYAHNLQREEELSTRYLAYVQANPQGAMATEARQTLAASYEAAGQAENAADVLEPLRANGDPDVIRKLDELYARTGLSPKPAGAPPPKAPFASSAGATTPGEPPRPGAPPHGARRPSEGPPGSGMSADRLQGVLDAA